VALRIHLQQPPRHAVADPVGTKRFARAVLASVGVADGAMSLVLTDNAGIHGLNARYRDIDRATDVLAFPLHEEDETGSIYLGDVVISVERAREQAPRFGNDFESELARLIAHGILHLMGHDHHTPHQGRAMRAAERRALAAFTPGTLLRARAGGWA
jgi:probable rRNA maturation factor